MSATDALSPGDLAPAERRAIAAQTHGAYRADIDGLRALAVLPVVLYHAGVRGFSGGFVGVDVFFVISGYLITGILVRDLEVGRHSIAEFYRRRILRIFPALAVVLAATTLAVGFFLLPGETRGYAMSLGATALFLSNVFFYANTDYFAIGAGSTPLLHTWSLAVEEQFYIVWPVLLALIGAGRRRAMLWTAIGASVASFLFALWLLPRDGPATFYLAPTRVWELGAGAILAIWPRRAAGRWINEALALAGVILILAAVKFYTHETPFPGLSAAVPVAGAALILASGDRAPWMGRLLSLPPLRFVGLISYSLYLWHWPVIVIADNGLFVARTVPVMIGMVMVSIILATLSWRFVERPFRTGVSGWRTPRVLAGGGGVIAVALALALALPPVFAALAGFTPEQRALSAYVNYDGDGAYRRGSCFQVGPRQAFDEGRCLTPTGNKPVVLIVGDSQAAHYWPGLARYRDRIDVLQATATGCVATLQHRDTACARVIDAVLRDRMSAIRPDRLILASRWRQDSLPALEATLNDPVIRAANPLLIGPMPEWTSALPRLLVFAERRGDPTLVERARASDRFALDDDVRAVAERTATPYISVIDLLCPAGRCRTRVAPGVPMLFDTAHLTAAGSAVAVDGMWPRLFPVSGRRPPAQHPNASADPTAANPRR